MQTRGESTKSTSPALKARAASRPRPAPGTAARVTEPRARESSAEIKSLAGAAAGGEESMSMAMVEQKRSTDWSLWGRMCVFIELRKFVTARLSAPRPAGAGASDALRRRHGHRQVTGRYSRQKCSRFCTDFKKMCAHKLRNALAFSMRIFTCTGWLASL